MSVTIKKWRRLTLPARASVWYTLTSALERGVNFVFTPIFTRTLTAEEYGLYPLYVSYMSLFTIFITLELTGNVVYRGMSKYKGREDEFISCTLGIMCLAFAVSFSIILVFGRHLAAFMGVSRSILVFLALQVFSNGVINLYLAKCRYLYEYKVATVINATLATIAPTLSFALINFTRVRAEARIVALLATTLALALPLGVSIIRRGRRIFEKEIWRFVLRLDLPLLPHFLAAAITAQSGKIIVGRYFGEEALAKYSVVFSMGFVFSLITVGINSALTPWVNRKLAEKKEDKITALINPAFTLFALMTLCGLCFCPEGLAFLAPPEYREALGAIYPLSISVLVGFLTTITNAVLLFRERSHLISAASIITACINLMLGLAITARFGYIAAAFVQLASALFLFFVSTAMAGGVSQKAVTNPKNHVTVIGFVAVVSVMLYLLRTELLSRILMFVALAMIAIPIAMRCKSLIIEKKV